MKLENFFALMNDTGNVRVIGRDGEAVYDGDIASFPYRHFDLLERDVDHISVDEESWRMCINVYID